MSGDCCVQDLNNTLMVDMVTRDWREETTFFKHSEQNPTDKQYTNTTPVHAINNIPTHHQFMPISVMFMLKCASVPAYDSSFLLNDVTFCCHRSLLQSLLLSSSVVFVLLVVRWFTSSLVASVPLFSGFVALSPGVLLPVC